MSFAYGPGGYVGVAPKPIQGRGVPSGSFKGQLGQQYFDVSVSPAKEYIYNGSTWEAGGNAYATTSAAGIVQLSSDVATDQASTTLVPYAKAVYDYGQSLVLAGANIATNATQGIGYVSTDAQAVARQANNTGVDAYFVTPANLTAVMSAPGPIGDTTADSGAFTTLATSGLASLSASATILTAGTALNLASDASNDAVNLGTAGARTVTIGNVTGATAVALNSGTGHITLTTASTGDIILNSADTVLIDGAGVVEINSSSAAISIGNDANAQAINIGTGAAARTITIGNATGATSLVLECGTGNLYIGQNAIARTVQIGNQTGSSALSLLSGTGNFVINGATSTAYTFGAATTTGTITIGGTAQTGTITLGSSSGTNAVSIGVGAGATTVNVATGVTGNTINLGTGVNTSAQVINIASGASAANSTVNILSGNGSAGTQTLNVLTGTRAGALNLATGAAAHVIAIGSSSAGAMTLDTAAGVSIDGATASNFTVTGAGQDLTLSSVGGSVAISSTEDAASAVSITANGGTSETIQITASQGTGAGSISLDSTAGGISLDAAVASNFTVTGAGQDLTLAAAGGSVKITSTENAAAAIALTTNAGTSETVVVTNTQGTSASAIALTSSAGGVALTGALAANAAAVQLSASAADGGITLDAGATPGVTFTNGTQSFQMLVGSGSPNGSVTAAQGSMYVDVAGSTSTTILFVNTDGSTTWVGVGA